jgi:hypothetical protein
MDASHIHIILTPPPQLPLTLPNPMLIQLEARKLFYETHRTIIVI